MEDTKGLALALIYAALFVGVVAMAIGFWEHYRKRKKDDDDD